MLQCAGACATYQQSVNCRAFLLYHMNIIENNNKISTKIKLQTNTDVISQYGCNSNTYVHYVGLVYLHKFICLFVDRIELYI